ncbi:hypothetical protein F5Y14DRAFT_76151 [Nemania sp. NC0429]|nr:hypothetical protein F5Y14DRAFT_76151 [Nemania sp. NC0429]
MVSTVTTALMTPSAPTENLDILAYREQARRAPIKVAWETADPSPSPLTSDVMSRTSSMAEYGWELNLNSATTITLTPSTSAPSESGTTYPGAFQDKPSRISDGALTAFIVIGMVLLFLLIFASVSLCNLRRPRHNPPNEFELVSPDFTGNRQRGVGYSWRIEASPPLPERRRNWGLPRIFGGRRREREPPAPIELTRSWSVVFSPANAHETRGSSDVVSPASDNAARPSSPP